MPQGRASVPRRVQGRTGPTTPSTRWGRRRYRADDAAYVRFLQALGLVDGDVDLDAVAASESDGVVGFYDTETKALYVRGVELAPEVARCSSTS